MRWKKKATIGLQVLHTCRCTHQQPSHHQRVSASNRHPVITHVTLQQQISTCSAASSGFSYYDNGKEGSQRQWVFLNVEEGSSRATISVRFVTALTLRRRRRYTLFIHSVVFPYIHKHNHMQIGEVAEQIGCQLAGAREQLGVRCLAQGLLCINTKNMNHHHILFNSL